MMCKVEKQGNLEGLKSGVAATLAGGFAMWGTAGVWHEVVAVAFYAGASNGHRHEGMGLISAAYLLLAALMAYFYPRMYEGRRPILEGAVFGMAMGLLWVFPHGLVMAGAHGESVGYVVRNALWHLVEQGIGGVVIAWVYRRMRRAYMER